MQSESKYPHSSTNAGESPVKLALLQRRGFVWLKNQEILVTIAPIPDKLTFYTKHFEEEENEENLNRIDTPYFVCKYFNPRYFDGNGNRIETPDHDEVRIAQYNEACDKVLENKKTVLQSGVNPDFITKQKMENDMDIIVILFAFTGRDNCVVNGFITCNDHNLLQEENKVENVLYIDVLGAIRRDTRNGQELPPITFGKKLIKDVENFARSKKYLGLTLSALTYVINYYRRYGFRHLDKLKDLEIMEENPEVTELANQFSRTTFGMDENITDYIFVEYIDKKYSFGTPEEKILKEMELYWKQRKYLDRYHENLLNGSVQDTNDDNRGNAEEFEVSDIELRLAYDTYKEKFPDNYEDRDKCKIGEFIQKLSTNGFSTIIPNYKNRKVHQAITNFKSFYAIPSGNRDDILQAVKNSPAGLEGWYGNLTDNGLDKFPFERDMEQGAGFKMTLQFEDMIEQAITNTSFILFIDLETSGLPVKDGWSNPHFRDLEAYDTSRVIQIGAMLCKSECLTPVRTKSVIIKACDFEISDKSYEVHGISKQQTMDEGKHFIDAIKDDMYPLFSRAKFVAAHNAHFDVNVLKSELVRSDDEVCKKMLYHLDKQAKVICTMQKTKDIVCAKNSKGTIKNPSLSELYKFATTKEITGHHDAMCDVVTMHEAVQKLVENGSLDLYKNKVVKKKSEIQSLKDDVAQMRREMNQMRISMTEQMTNQTNAVLEAIRGLRI